MKQIGIILVLLTYCGSVEAQLSNGLYATFDTNLGSFTARLDYAEAPLTCANFAGLAEGSQKWIDPSTGKIRSDPFYDGLIFHRVIDDFMIQGGDPLGTGGGGPGYAFPDEFTSLTHQDPGILSMANSGPDSNGSQFFITLTNTYWLNGKHSVFGEVIDGMNVISNIGLVATDSGDRPLIDITIDQVNILRIGTDAENFDPLAQSLPEVIPLPLAILNTSSGVVASVTIANLCKQTVYEKETLSDPTTWSVIGTNYWQVGGGTWVTPIATNQPTQFFCGTRVYHPLATTRLIAGHTLEITFGLNEIILNPTAKGGGTSALNGTPGSITSWSFDPSYCGYIFITDIMAPLSLDFEYETSTNGVFSGFYYSNGWQPMSGPFTDTLAP